MPQLKVGLLFPRSQTIYHNYRASYSEFPRAGLSLIRCYIQYLTDVKLFLAFPQEYAPSPHWWTLPKLCIINEQENLSNSLLIWLYSSYAQSWSVKNMIDGLSLFSLPLHIHRINNYFKSVQKWNQSWRQHSCINNVSYVYIMTGSRGYGDRSCLSLNCISEVMCCDQRNAALTWPAVSHSWSFTGLPSTATTAAEKNTSKSETTICLVGLPSSLTYTGMVDKL